MAKELKDMIDPEKLKNQTKKEDEKTEEVKETEMEKEEKEEVVEVVKSKLSKNSEKLLNQVLDSETRFMMLQSFLSACCNLQDDKIGNHYYVYHSDDCKYNVSKIVKYFKKKCATITETNIEIPTLDFTIYKDKIKTMEFIKTHLEELIKTYSDISVSLFNNKDVVSYDIVACILRTKDWYLDEINECIEQCGYKDKKVTINIERDSYYGSKIDVVFSEKGENKVSNSMDY